MTTQVPQNTTKQPTLSQKALRLLAAHDREIQGLNQFQPANRRTNRWA